MTAELNSLDFSEKIVEISIAVILHQAGFHSSEKSALNILTAVVPLYINLLVKNPHLLINDSIASFFHNWASLDSAPFPRLVPPKYPVPFHLVTKDPNPPKIIPVKTPDSPKIVKKHSIFSTLPPDLNIDTSSDVSINENDPVLETISSLKPNDSKLFKSYYSKLLDPYSLKDADPLNNSTLIVKNLLINTLPYLPNLTSTTQCHVLLDASRVY